MEMRAVLDALYERLNRRCFVSPDPLELLYRYPDPLDRELAGLVVSGLSYGRVASILKGARAVLDPLGPSPAALLADPDGRHPSVPCPGFRYRFTEGREVAALLRGAAALQAGHGSLGTLFAGLSSRMDHSEACDAFVDALHAAAGLSSSTLLSKPSDGSACKRLHLYLRWMVRSDDVDPGGWKAIGRERLEVPLDVHMHAAGRLLGFTDRRSADRRTVEEITRGFRRMTPEDPVKYDFALTRFGIRSDLRVEDLEEELLGCLPGGGSGG